MARKRHRDDLAFNAAMGWKHVAIVLLMLSLIIQSVAVRASTSHAHGCCPGQASEAQATAAADCCDEQAPDRKHRSADCGAMAPSAGATAAPSACDGDCAGAATAVALPAMELPPAGTPAFARVRVEPAETLSEPARRRDRPPRR